MLISTNTIGRAKTLIIARYLNKQIIKSNIVVLVVLLLLFEGQRFVLYLSGAAKGKFSSDLVLTLLALQTPVFISYLLPLSMFLALLITLGKLHADNEMTIISACGVSNLKILSYFIPYMFILTLFTAYLTLFQAPVAIFTQQELLKEQKKKGELNLITPGRFQQSSDGNKIIYVEEMTKNDEMKRIFFVQQNTNKDYEFSLLVADKGYYWSDENEQNFLALENGHQYQGSPGSNELRTLSFERYFMELKSKTDDSVINKLTAKTTPRLFNEQTPENIAEIQWRLSAPLSIPLLLILAIPLARVQPRQGKFGKLLPGLMAYIVYMILILTMRSSMEDDKISPWLGMWWVHLGLLIYGMSEFQKWNWLKSLVQRSKPKQNRAAE